MKLLLSSFGESTYKDVIAAVSWNTSNDLYACDDQAIWRWSRNGELIQKICIEDACFTELHCYPSTPQKQRSGLGADVFAIACTDGTFRIINKIGKEEKRVEAHGGVVLSLRWNAEGTALATGGEDGSVKTWSRSGMLRSTLAQTGSPVYAIAWSPDSDRVLYPCHGRLIIKLSQSTKHIEWQGHDGLVLALDWNSINGCIVSCGEDCSYKLWDCHGRPIYQSSKYGNAITSVAWSPFGDMFALGSYNSLLLCDKTGWLISRHQHLVGSLLKLAWSFDGTQLAGAGTKSSILLAQCVGRKLEWSKASAIIEDSNHIKVNNILTGLSELLEFRDRVIKISLGFGYLVVTTTSQCYIYSAANWKLVHISEMKDTILLIKQCQRYFLFVGCFTGLHLFGYDGRQLCSSKLQGLHPEALNDKNLSICNDTIAFVDTCDHKVVQFIDANSGKVFTNAFRHNLDIAEIGLNQMGNSALRKLAFIDHNQDLYIILTTKPGAFKLSTMVEAARWNDTSDMLVALVDQKLIVWCYPHAAYIDQDLLERIKVVKEYDLGKSPSIISFNGSQCTVRRTDGAINITYICPYAQILLEYAISKQWNFALQLCRFMKDELLWACLAPLAVEAREFGIAEEAYAALDRVDKVQFMNHLKDIALEEVSSAELALFKRQPDEAESLLLQAGLTYRAIHVNLKLFNWDRALELAVTYKTHIDTVLWYRQHYLSTLKSVETKQQYLQYMDRVSIDFDKIREKIHQEIIEEASRHAVRTGEVGS